MVRKTDISEAAAGAEPGMEAPVPARRAVLKAAASVPVILTILGGPARAGYENGEYIPYICQIFPQPTPPPDPEDCPVPRN